MSQHVLAVGAPGDNSNEGSVYIWEYHNRDWAWLEKKLTATDTASNDEFGHDVAVTGVDTVIVAAHKHATNSLSNSGAVYIFHRCPLSMTEHGCVPCTPRFVYGTADHHGRFSAGTWSEGPSQAGTLAADKDWWGCNWKLKKKVSAGDAASGDLFGSSIFLRCWLVYSNI